MRGKWTDDYNRDMRRRIIPAHAGQTIVWVCRRYRNPDHPRACGANKGFGILDTLDEGSSPRMRGKQLSILFARKPARIIPAHAGQTFHGRRGSAQDPDHPRACGANFVILNVVHELRGSSPRMRGKRRRCRGCIVVFRIIPAHAGQTTWDRWNTSHTPDHPRACGANGQGRARIAGRERIIPAHAGQTSTRCARSPSTMDHPRACGANCRGV